MAKFDSNPFQGDGKIDTDFGAVGAAYVANAATKQPADDVGIMGNTYVTNVTKTGLGDTQYTGIMGGIGGVQKSQNAGFANTQKGFTDLNTYLGERFNTANEERYDLQRTTQLGQLALDEAAKGREALAEAARTQMGTDIGTGFNDMGVRFDTVDTNVGNVQTAVDQGFVDQATGFADAQINRDALDRANQTNMNTQFGAVDEALTTGLNQANTDRDERSLENRTQQDALAKTLGTMGTSADTYAAQSLENQGNIQSGIDGAASTFDTYVNRYAEDQTLAQKTRADMQLANSNASAQLQNQLQNNFNQNPSAQSDVPASLAPFTQVNYANQQANYQNNVNAIRSVQNQLASGSGQLDGTQVRAVADMAQMASTQNDLSVEQRQEFYALGTAFDENGQLIQNGIDGQGYVTQRSIDASGNMIINTFNAAGQPVGMGNVNLNNAMQRLSELPQIQGSNAQTGNTGPREGSLYGLASPSSLGPSGDGFISPNPIAYAQTQ